MRENDYWNRFPRFFLPKSSFNIRRSIDKGRWYRMGVEQWTMICFITFANRPYSLCPLSSLSVGSVLPLQLTRLACFKPTCFLFFSLLVHSTWFVPQTPESIETLTSKISIILFSDGCSWLVWLKAPGKDQCQSPWLKDNELPLVHY